MYEVQDDKGRSYGFFFNRDTAMLEANRLIMNEHVYAKVMFNGGQDVALIKACTQKNVTTAFDSLKTMQRAKSKKMMSPVKVIRGEKEYTIPVAMLDKDGKLKASVPDLVNAYFKAAAKAQA
jgi:hypothetical protein